MNRLFFVFLSIVFGIWLGSGCGKDRAPISPVSGEEGEIAIEVTYAPWRPLAAKSAGTEALDKATAWVYDAEDEKVAEKDLEIAEGRAKGSLTVRAQKNLRVVLGLFEGETVRFLGEDSVDVPAGGSATAHITEEYLGTTVTVPDSVLAGQEYRISWTSRPFVQWYEVQESVHSDFSGAGWVYSGPDTTCTIGAKSEYDTGSAYYYRARVVTEYGPGPWHGAASAGVAGEGGTIIIDFPLPEEVPPGSETISLITSRGGERWAAGSTQSIRWKSTGVKRVNIEYSTDNGVSWTSLASDVDAEIGFWAWTLPRTTSSSCIVRITDAANPRLAISSDRPFVILELQSSITVTSPDGGEHLTGDNTHAITWESVNVGNVRIAYTTDGGNYWSLIADGVSAAAGTYSWKVPQINTTRCQVRVSSVSDSEISDISNAVFSIETSKPYITLISPNGGETLVGGTLYDIAWSSTRVNTVHISIRGQGGVYWIPIASGVSASTGRYSWKVPDQFFTSQPVSGQATVKIRIEDEDNDSVFDESNNFFTVAF